jgi:hypothetical protein
MLLLMLNAELTSDQSWVYLFQTKGYFENLVGIEVEMN